MKKWKSKKTENLLKAILSLRDAKEAVCFFRDLLTEREIIEFGNRWQAANMLSKKIPYPQIKSKTGLSTRTIARVSRWLKRGMGGYKLIIQRLHHGNSFPAGKRLL
jgi:TrpR-related protein YerC/YecD